MKTWINIENTTSRWGREGSLSKKMRSFIVDFLRVEFYMSKCLMILRILFLFKLKIWVRRGIIVKKYINKSSNNNLKIVFI